MAIVYKFRDYQSKAAIERAKKAPEEHLKQDAAQIMGGLWHNDAGNIGLNPYYRAPEKDPA